MEFKGKMKEIKSCTNCRKAVLYGGELIGCVDKVFAGELLVENVDKLMWFSCKRYEEDYT